MKIRLFLLILVMLSLQPGVLSLEGLEGEAVLDSLSDPSVKYTESFYLALLALVLLIILIFLIIYFTLRKPRNKWRR